jgi:hypothetical protein
MKNELIFAAGLAAMIACGSSSSSSGGPTSISASSYDQNCQQPSDCTPVDEGQVCGPGCGLICPNAAINQSVLSTYQSDLKRITASCTVQPVPCGAGCPGPLVLTCVGGRCGLCMGGACADAGSGDAGHDAGSD